MHESMWSSMWAWAALVGLGAFHGINPGMGWLFAVALGMQERSRSAVWRALGPLTAGHALAIGAVILVAVLTGFLTPLAYLKIPVGIVLIALGVYRLVRHRHPVYGGMRVGMGRLTAWSFLMASAHGAGLMVAPIFLGLAAPAAGASCHAHAASATPTAVTGLLATGAHGAGYLMVTAIAAWIVYEKLGLGLLRKAWVNLDWIWALSLVVTGLVTVFV